MALKDKELDIDLIKMYKKERRRFKNSVKYSLSGLKMAYSGEGSLKLHAFMTFLVIILGIVFKLDTRDFALAIIMMGMILGIELLNTSIESCVDLVTKEIHPLAKRSKDIGSAASFSISIFAGIGELIIFIPYIIAFFK